MTLAVDLGNCGFSLVAGAELQSTSTCVAVYTTSYTGYCLSYSEICRPDRRRDGNDETKKSRHRNTQRFE